MLPKVVFDSSDILSSDSLPLTLISLEDWAIVRITGKDSINYLQNQLTCDILKLSKNHFSFAAHCNSQGKVLSVLYLFYYKEGIAFIERRSVCHLQISEMKKYATFSQINIFIDDTVVLLGLTGFKVKDSIKYLFKYIPNSINTVVHNKDTTILYFNLPVPRFLLITTLKTCNLLKIILKGNIQLNNSKQWLAQDIEAGYPIIDSINSSIFIPQAINLQRLNGINFNKGCYLGQEIIARAKYHGYNKLSLNWLIGKKSFKSIIFNYILEIKIRDSWRRTGKILATCNIKNNIVWVQAVLNNDLISSNIFRIKDNDNVLYLSKLNNTMNV